MKLFPCVPLRSGHILSYHLERADKDSFRRTNWFQVIILVSGSNLMKQHTHDLNQHSGNFHAANINYSSSCFK